MKINNANELKVLNIIFSFNFLLKCCVTLREFIFSKDFYNFDYKHVEGAYSQNYYLCLFECYVTLTHFYFNGQKLQNYMLEMNH